MLTILAVAGPGTLLRKWWDRRRRVRRPWTLLVFGVLFCALPFVNYVWAAYSMHVPLRFYRLILSALNPFEWFLLFVPLPVGLGLLLVRKWAWYLLLAYGVVLSGYNIFVAAFAFSRYNLGALFMTVFGLSAVAYFVRRDVAAPFMKMYPRGWRGQQRTPVGVSVRVNGRLLLSRDISERGLYVEWPDFDGSTGNNVEVRLELAGMTFELRAGVARVDRGFGVGLAFRDMEPTVALDLGQALRVRAREEAGMREKREMLRAEAKRSGAARGMVH